MCSIQSYISCTSSKKGKRTVLRKRFFSTFTGSLYWFVDLNVAAAAGTSSSLGKISGTGPTGVMLYIFSQQTSAYPLATRKSRASGRTYMRINLPMTLGIMFLNMFKLRRFPKSRHIPIQMPQPFMQRGKPGADVADVAFEMLDVDGVEADDGGVEADVGFGDGGAEVVGGGVGGEVGFGAGERGEEGVDGFFVGFLGAIRRRVFS